MTTLRHSFPLVVLGLLAAAGGAAAQSFDAVRLFSPPKGNGSGSFGAVAVAGREYPGSDERRNLLLPVVNYRWKNGWFAGTGNGIGYLFDSAEHVQYGLRLTADLGRRSKRSAVLQGMDNIDAAPEAGAFFNFFFSRELFVTSSLRYGAGDGHDGVLLDLGANYATLLAPQWRVNVGVATTLANRSYLQSYFGVAPDKATASRPAYSAGAGTRDVRASASLTYAINPQWDATVALSASALQGDARHSPLVRDRTPVTGIIAVTRDF